MALCEVVIQMADAVAAVRAPLTPSEQLRVENLRQIVRFRDMRRLDLWESLVNSQKGRPKTPTGELLDEVEMLGMCNLYQKFQVERTREYYSRLVRFFAENGVHIPESPDVSTW
jgi:hypothetical protein